MFARQRPKTLPQVLQIRKELARPRREPLRIIIAADPKRPVRTVVLPRLLPLVVVGVAAALILVALGLSFTSWRLGSSVGRLQGRVAQMVHAAEDVAQHPLPVMMTTAGVVPTVLKPVGNKGQFTLESVNTGAQLVVTIDLASGEVEPASYRALRHFMRCLRTGAETPLDPRLVELLYRIAQRTGQKIELVSGFRAPMFSTADLSYHTRGMAADIRIPGMTPLMVRDLVHAMGIKGVGYYPVSQFVHVDVREEKASWTDYGRSRQDGEGSEHGADPAAPSASP